MQKNKVTILSTSLIGKTLIQEAALHDIIIDEISFINTEEIIDSPVAKRIKQLSHENINAVFTSMNAVKTVKKYIASQVSWKIFCIGNTTKQLAHNILGEKNISGTADSALHLAENIMSYPAIKKVYFFCGDQRRNELPLKLTENNIEVEELVVYKTIQRPQLIKKKYDGILFFSPSAVQSFFSKNSIQPDMQIFVIGNTTAGALKAFTQQHIITADMPGKKNLVEQVINHFSKTKIY